MEAGNTRPQYATNLDTDRRTDVAAGSSGGSLCLEETDILAAVFKNLAVGVVVCDTNGHCVFFNPEAERILGISAMHAECAAWSATYGCFRPDMVTPYSSEDLPLARAIRGEEALDELIFIRNPQQPAGLWIAASATP